MPLEFDGCDPRIAKLLKQWLTLGSFALMTAERLAAVSLSLTHNNLDAIAHNAHEAQEVRDMLHQLSLQRAAAISMVQMAASHTELLRDLAEELNCELADVINDLSSLTSQVM